MSEGRRNVHRPVAKSRVASAVGASAVRAKAVGAKATGASRRATRRGRPRSPASEDALLQATLAILREDGYAGLTLDKVAARARASKTTIYRRWPKKENLLLAAFTSMPFSGVPDRGSVVAEMLELQLAILRGNRSRTFRGTFGLIAGICAQFPELGLQFRPVMLRQRAPVEDVVKRAIARGELPRDIDVAFAVEQFVGPFFTKVVYDWGDFDPAMLRRSISATLAGLLASSD